MAPTTLLTATTTVVASMEGKSALSSTLWRVICTLGEPMPMLAVLPPKQDISLSATDMLCVASISMTMRVTVQPLKSSTQSILSTFESISTLTQLVNFSRTMSSLWPKMIAPLSWIQRRAASARTKATWMRWQTISMAIWFWPWVSGLTTTLAGFNMALALQVVMMPPCTESQTSRSPQLRISNSLATLKGSTPLPLPQNESHSSYLLKHIINQLT